MSLPQSKTYATEKIFLVTLYLQQSSTSSHQSIWEKRKSTYQGSKKSLGKFPPNFSAPIGLGMMRNQPTSAAF